jgi:D-aspartate ligase
MSGELDPNPTRARADWPAAVIAGAHQTSVLGMRALAKRGVRTFCFDSDTANAGFRTVWGRAYEAPNPDLDPGGWVRFMARLAGEVGGKPVLIAGADLFVSAIAAHADELGKYFTLSPGVPLQGRLATKQTQYALAAEHGMPMPRTLLAHSLEDVEAFAKDAVFPCLLKPIHFREWERFQPGHRFYCQKIAIAKTPAELAGAFRDAATINPEVILQEIIEGPDIGKRVYCSVYDRNGQRIGNALFRSLRCRPLQFGPASVTEPVDDPQTDEICDRWLRAIGYSGICEIEMKYDTRDGRVKLIEANPRLSGGGDAAPYAGIPLAWLHYLDLIGEKVTPVRPNGRDFRHIVLRQDVDAIRRYRAAGLLTWAELARSYRPPLAFYDIDWRDWRYTAGTLYRAARSAAAGVVLGILGRERH